MRKLIGPHLAGGWASHLDILRKWQPPLALVLSPEVDKVRQLREACPDTIIVGRFYHDDSDYASNINSRPKEFAREIHQEIANNPVTPLLDYAQSNNEVCQDWEGIQKLNIYTQEWMFLADQSQMYKCAILAFSVGNPDLPHKPGDPAGFDGRMLYWQQVLPSLNYAQQRGHILWMHAYGFPDMFHPDAAWYIYRYERQVQGNLRTLGITNLKYGYGEQGIDRYITGERGGYKSVPTTDENYVNQELQWERDLQDEDLLLGGAIFTAGDSGGWDSYDIFSTNVAAMIADHYVAHAADYSSPTGGNGDEDEGNTIFIPDVGTGGTPMPAPTRNFDPRAFDRGVRVETPSVAPGQTYWFAYEIKFYDEQEADQLGPDHHFMIDVRDENDQRVVGKDVMIAWSNGQAPQKTESKTGEEYATGFGMSPGKNAYSGHVSDALPSERVSGVGMGAETPGGWNAGIHTTTGVKWRKEIMAATQPAPAPPVTQPAPQPEQPMVMPTLIHPVKDPALRRVTQVFGARPEFYSQYKIDGVPLKGHEGIDFGTPVGSIIVAADAGRVAEVADQGDKGYGKYIKVVHAWGETVYAHLSAHAVALGQQVVRGQPIGASGNTGNSSGPHLHFGIRIKPFDRKDGWGGYTNPAPFLSVTATSPTDITPAVIPALKAAALEFKVDWRFLASFAYAESSFNPRAVSRTGAGGLMQISTGTWGEWAPRLGATDINNPVDNARVGAAYYKHLLAYYEGDVKKALTAYNFGPGNVDAGKEVPIETIIFVYKILHGSDLAKALGL